MLRLPPVTADTPPGDLRQRILFELSEDQMGYLTSHEVGHTKVYTTEELANRRKRFSYQDGVVIGPNRPFQLLIVAVIAGVVGLCISSSGSVSFPIWLAYFLSFAVCFGVLRLIPDFNLKVKIDRSGIQIGEDRFEWVGMIGIFAVTVGPRASGNSKRRIFVVIIDRQGNFFAHEFNSLSVRFETFCAVIEYFRPGGCRPG